MKALFIFVFLFLGSSLRAQERSLRLDYLQFQTNFSSNQIKMNLPKEQIQEEKSRIPHILLSILFPIVSSTAEYFWYRQVYVDKTDEEIISDDRLQHNWKFLSWVSGVGLGVSIGLRNPDFNFKKLGVDLLFSGAVFWNLYDASFNLQRGFHFMRTSKESGSLFEQFNLLKLPILAIAIVFYVLERG